MPEIIQNSLNIYALSFLTGVLGSLFLVVSKTLMIFLLFLKKQVALGTTVIVLSEAIIGFSLYLLIARFEIDSEYLMMGFVSGLFVSLAATLLVFVIKASNKDNESKEVGK